MRILINACLLLLGFTITVAAQDVPLNNPFESFSAPTIREVKISNALVATINNGDFVHPTFSPDAKLLAYSRVILKRDFESAEVLQYDFRTHKHSVLLNSRRAEKYGTYKAFVAEMQWKSARRLEISIGDGDVGLTDLIFDPVNRKVLRERFDQFDEFEPTLLSPVHQKAYQQAQALFPAESTLVFDGGVSFKSSIIVVLSRSPKTYLFIYRDGKTTALGEFNSNGVQGIEVKHVSPSRVIFLIRTHAPSERGDNPLYIFDGSQLVRVKEYSELYDADVDRNGRRIAYCYWVGDKRHIVVKELDFGNN